MKVIQLRRSNGCGVIDKGTQDRRRRAADALGIRTVVEDLLLKSFEKRGVIVIVFQKVLVIVHCILSMGFRQSEACFFPPGRMPNLRRRRSSSLLVAMRIASFEVSRFFANSSHWALAPYLAKSAWRTSGEVSRRIVSTSRRASTPFAAAGTDGARGSRSALLPRRSSLAVARLCRLTAFR